MTTTYTVDPERLAQIPTRRYTAGKHNGPDDGMCLVEAAAWVAGEPFSDHPVCVDPVIAAFAEFNSRVTSQWQ